MSSDLKKLLRIFGVPYASSPILQGANRLIGESAHPDGEGYNTTTQTKYIKIYIKI